MKIKRHVGFQHYIRLMERFVTWCNEKSPEAQYQHNELVVYCCVPVTGVCLFANWQEQKTESNYLYAFTCSDWKLILIEHEEDINCYDLDASHTTATPGSTGDLYNHRHFSVVSQDQCHQFSVSLLFLSCGVNNGQTKKNFKMSWKLLCQNEADLWPFGYQISSIHHFILSRRTCDILSKLVYESLGCGRL